MPAGQSRQAAEELARQLAGFPQTCMREDRLSLLEQEGLEEQAALQNEFARGLESLPEATQGIERFRGGAGRHGDFA